MSFSHAVDSSLEKWGIPPAMIYACVGIVLLAVCLSIIDVPVSRWVSILLALSPLWLPYILFHEFFHEWMLYVQLKFDLEQGRTTLEIQFPQEVMKSPLAMELALIQLYQTASPDNHLQTYVDGKHPPTYGLEIVSDGGKIHFYINTPRKKFKNMWEAQLYAQYPGIIITELPIDYTAAVPWDPKRYGYFALHFKLKKPDPYPIKTYIDFGLGDDPKEEFKIDPITSMLEFMGSIGPKEKVWAQLLISANRDEDFKVGSLHFKPDWKGAVRAEIDKMAQRDSKKKGEVEFESAPRVTPGERETIAALERSLSKYAFNAKLRCMYIGELDVPGGFTPGERIGAIISMWRAFDDVNRNGIGFAWRTDYDWNWWQDPSGKKKEHHKHRELADYKKREYNHQNDNDGGFILTTEEIATIFHPVGAVVLTPTLERVPSARSEAPANLPRGV